MYLQVGQRQQGSAKRKRPEEAEEMMSFPKDMLSEKESYILHRDVETNQPNDATTNKLQFSFVKLDQPKRKRKARGQDYFLRTTSTTKTHTLWQRLTELMQPSPAKGCRWPAQLATERNICGIDVALREKTAVGGGGGTWNDGRMKDKLIWEFHKKRNFSTLLWLAMPGWSFLWCDIFVVTVRGISWYFQLFTSRPLWTILVCSLRQQKSRWGSLGVFSWRTQKVLKGSLGKTWPLPPSRHPAILSPPFSWGAEMSWFLCLAHTSALVSKSQVE